MSKEYARKIVDHALSFSPEEGMTEWQRYEQIKKILFEYIRNHGDHEYAIKYLSERLGV